MQSLNTAILSGAAKVTRPSGLKGREVDRDDREAGSGQARERRRRKNRYIPGYLEEFYPGRPHRARIGEEESLLRSLEGCLRICLVRRMSRDQQEGPGDELVSRLLRGEAGGGELENRLLRELHEGYAVSKLRLLLRSPDEEVVAAGMWIASELGAAAKPLFADIVDLIHHPALKVRFFALDCLVACARPGDGRAITLGLDLLDDAELGVRWKAMVFAATAEVVLLRAARDVLGANEQKGARQSGLDLLMSASSSPDGTVVTSALKSSDPILRRYAAAAAARLVNRNPHPLKHAMKSTDPEIKQFASDMAARAGITVTS